MSNSYRNGAFALGTLVGLGLTLNLIFWSAYYVEQSANQNSNTQDHKEQSQQNERAEPLFSPEWFFHDGNWISSSDSLAQWIMAIFTIIAAGLLYFTLRQANKTNESAVKAANAAIEANNIILNQGAGYLAVKKAFVQAKRDGVIIVVDVDNIGDRTCFDAKVVGKLTYRWGEGGQNGVQKWHSSIADFDIFIGVVGRNQSRFGLAYIPSVIFFGQADPDSYGNCIVENTSPDIECRVSWGDAVTPIGNERHILSAMGRNEIMDAQKGEIIELSTAFSGLPEGWGKDRYSKRQ